MKYDKIEVTDDSDSVQDVNESLFPENTTSPPKRRGLSLFCWALIVEHILLALVFIALWRVFVPPPTRLQYQVLTEDNKTYPSGQLSWSQHWDPLPCGKTPEEAIARGCHFDMLVTAWLPARCIDTELVDEFMEIGQWEFYTRLHGETKHASYEPDVLGAISKRKGIWTSRRWHVTHCLYMFKKLSRALVNGWPVDAEAISEPHTEHCMGAFKEALFGPPLDPDEIEVFLEIIYPPC
ncbi:hypothetical protein GQ53DRAFT_861943 [Thozetella sp. PMI_491]|nr:hypothetical protein GQ53DRAFT_861943 [Thozetella sp. PMI_491]